MNRRHFLIGTGGTALGGSVLLGSGAFTRVESQRRVKIQVARDPDAYLGLDECPDSPNRSYTGIDDDGHLFVEMSPENPNLEDPDRGIGVNSDSFTWFDDVFQVCNQGKQTISVWIEAEDNPELDGPPAEYDDDLPRVQFYTTDNQNTLLAGEDDAVQLDVGECTCFGMRVMTKGLSTEDQLLEDDEIVIHAAGEPPVVDPAPDPEDYERILDAMDGDGSPDDPYIIRKLKQLQAIAGDPTASYRLGNDIDASPTQHWNRENGIARGFDPISDFTGTFDGDGYTIERLTITRPEESRVGLFGSVEEDVSIADVRLTQVAVSGGNNVGALVGSTSILGEQEIHGITVEGGQVDGSDDVGGLVGSGDTMTVANSDVTCDVTGDDFVGGLVGQSDPMVTVSGSSATGRVEGVEYVGGLVGQSGFGGSISGSHATGNVTGETFVGGLVGQNDEFTSVNESYATGTVEGDTRVGGLVGCNREDCTVSESHATGAVEGNHSVGGLIGSSTEQSSVSMSHATGTVKGTSRVGGLIGTSSGAGRLSESYATGAVEGTNRVGGLIGLADGAVGSIGKVYATGMVNGDTTVGGLIGRHSDMPVREAYATGSVEGDENVGGLIGTNVPPPDPEDSYWDVPATGQEDSDGGTGLGNIADDPPADEMTGEDATVYMDGFDFTGTWETVVDPDDYPVLVALDRDEQLANRA